VQFQVLEPGDSSWHKLFNFLPYNQRDVFYSSGFASLCQRTIESRNLVRCATFFKDNNSVILYPFVLRRLEDKINLPITRGLVDTVSLYGRGGVVGNASEIEINDFNYQIDNYMKLNNVVCSFDRFHPVISNEKFASPSARIFNVGGFVVVDLQPCQSNIEDNFKPSVRKDIRKAQRNGIRCFSESNCDHLSTFIDIYYQTMERNSASSFYYFTEDFFSALPEYLPGMFRYFYAEINGRIISCELVLYCGKYSHSFLGGTHKDCLTLAANPLLKYEVCKTMSVLGCKYFLLGGGVEPNDGIFNFKKAYSPNGVFNSWVGGKIWMPEIYENLKKEMIDAELSMSTNRFQYYDN